MLRVRARSRSRDTRARRRSGGGSGAATQHATGRGGTRALAFAGTPAHTGLVFLTRRRRPADALSRVQQRRIAGFSRRTHCNLHMGVSSLALNEDGESALKAGNLHAAHELFSKARAAHCVGKTPRLRCGSTRRSARPAELRSSPPRAARWRADGRAARQAAAATSDDVRPLLNRAECSLQVRPRPQRARARSRLFAFKTAVGPRGCGAVGR